MIELSRILSPIKRYAVLLCLTAALAAAASAQITLDNTASQGVFNPPLSPTIGMTWTHTVNSCTHCVLYIGVTTYEQIPTTTSPVLSITYNGTDITANSLGFQASPTAAAPNVGNSTVQIYRLIAPSVGTGTINVTFSPTLSYVFGSSLSFNGVNQGTPNGPWNSSSGDASAGAQPALSVAGGASGSVILDIIGSTPTAGFLAPGTNQVVCSGAAEASCTRGRGFFNTSFDIGAMSRKASSGTVNSTSWSMSTADVWALGGIAVTYDGTTAGEGSIQGQLLTSDGRGVGGATIYAQDNKGNLLTSVSNPFGYFSFDDLSVGETYILSATSRMYDFQPVAVTLNDSATGVQIVAISADTPQDVPASVTARPRTSVQRAAARPVDDN